MFRLNQILKIITRKFNDCCKYQPQCGVCPKYEYMSPACKVAVITGGDSGIGLAIATELLCNEAYRVVLASCDPEAGKNALKQLSKSYPPEKSCFVQMDVRSDAEFQYGLNTISQKFGGIDILVNNAGIINDALWETEIDAAVARGTLLGIDLMRKSKTHPGGVVINIGSTLTFDESNSFPVYTATQHAIGGFTKDKEHFNESGIRVIGICPGWTATSFLKCPTGLIDTPKNVIKQMRKAPQTASIVGRSVIYTIQYAPSGSLWVVDKNELFKTDIPKRKSFSRRIQYV